MAELNAHPKGLEALATELLIAILSEISDLRSLSSATSASRTIHHAFVTAKLAILSKVLANQVGADLMQDALEAVRWTHANRNALTAETARVPGLLTMDEVLFIARLGPTVSAFAKRFALSAADVQPNLQVLSPLPNTSELGRIERTFYRFETFRNLFSNPLDEASADLFLGSLPPCEVEQLGCVHDFLFHQIKLGTDDTISN